MYINVLYNRTKLYNFKKINALTIGSQSYLNNTDLCTLYKQFGYSVAKYINGEFAFALYNSKANLYFCARDPLGINELYYTKENETYHFSNNINDLLDIKSITKKPNLDAMKSMLFHRTIDYTHTMYEGIFRLPPGHFMIVEKGREVLTRYWHPEKISIDYSLDEREASEKVRLLLKQAIDRRVINLDETAFELSGGVDSSSIVSLLCQNKEAKDIDCYSMDFSGLKCDENKYIESIKETYQINSQKIFSNSLDYKHRYSLKNLHNLSPNWPVNMTFASGLPMYEQMKKDNKKIVITGQGGDHLFEGSPYVLYDLFRRAKFSALYDELKYYPKQWDAIKTYILKPLLGDKTLKWLRRFRGRNNTSPFLQESTSIKEFSDLIKADNKLFKDDLDIFTSSFNSLRLDGGFFHCAEKNFDVEIQHPFFDIDLIEFVLSLPPEMKYKQRTIKWILRKAMDGVLPNKIKNRQDKAEFSEILYQQTDACDVDMLLSNPYIVKLGLIEQNLIDEYVEKYKTKTLKYILLFWNIIALEYWYRYNFESKSLESLS